MPPVRRYGAQPGSSPPPPPRPFPKVLDAVAMSGLPQGQKRAAEDPDPGPRARRSPPPGRAEAEGETATGSAGHGAAPVPAEMTEAVPPQEEVADQVPGLPPRGAVVPLPLTQVEEARDAARMRRAPPDELPVAKQARRSASPHLAASEEAGDSLTRRGVRRVADGGLRGREAWASLGRSVRARTWLSSTFGPNWATDFHLSHELKVGIPVVYCCRCVRHCSSRRHARGLLQPCDGPPPEGSVLWSRLNSIEEDARHPVTKNPLEEPPLLVRLGTATQAAKRRKP